MRDKEEILQQYRYIIKRLDNLKKKDTSKYNDRQRASHDMWIKELEIKKDVFDWILK